jgi:hypothetical protein
VLRLNESVTRNETHHPGATAAEESRVPPTSVLVQYQGNPTSKVVGMPRFLRLVAGDPRAATAATPAGTAQWSCTGSTQRRTQLYPLCPSGERVLRIYDFPSCWDGRRTDSPTHRAHALYPAADGSCPPNSFPIPRLHLEIGYTVPPGRSFLIDAFPEQHHSPITDHANFINVMPAPLMERVVTCLNSGRRC